MLTGGNTAKKLYHHWFVSQPWDHRKIRYYFGDERCVLPEHQESNFGMVRKTLFPEGIPDNSKVMRMEGELSDRETAAKNYERMLPNSLDILLLSVGPDGHIASLFPYNHALNEETRLVVPVEVTKTPLKRLTITSPVIRSAKSVFLFAIGEEKGRILAKVLDKPDDIASLPVCKVICSTWLLDSDAYSLLK